MFVEIKLYTWRARFFQKNTVTQKSVIVIAWSLAFYGIEAKFAEKAWGSQEEI